MKKYLFILLSFILVVKAYSAPSNSMSITPVAVTGAKITASDENDRNNVISSAYNAHTHTDISQVANTFNIGDGAAGNKIINAYNADTNKPFIKYDDTANNWVVSTDGVAPSVVLSGTAIAFEGATDNAYETYLLVTEPTVDRTITLPDADINFVTGLAVVNGGTGATTAAAARTSLGIVYNDGSVNSTNLLSNGDYEIWTEGTSVAPSGWTSSGAGIAIAREGTTIKINSYSTKITGSDENLYQQVHSTRGIAYWKNRNANFGCWVYAANASRVRIGLYDGVGWTYSSYHTGGSSWELLTVTRTISGSATEVRAALVLTAGASISAYFDGAIAVEGESAFAFSSKPYVNEYANNAANGVVVPTGAVNAANGAVVLNASSQLPAVSGALLTNLPTYTPTQVNDTDAGTTFDNDPAVTFLTKDKTITSGHTVLLIATGYVVVNTTPGDITLLLKQGSTTVQTIVVSPAHTAQEMPWAASGIVTGLSGSITFSVTAQGPAAENCTAYGNLEVIEF